MGGGIVGIEKVAKCPHWTCGLQKPIHLAGEESLAFDAHAQFPPSKRCILYIVLLQIRN